jgi:glycosyltransferase involved in cell wall biosynthesis
VSAPVRVAIVARSAAPLHGHGGLERHVHDLARHLAESGLHVTLITRQPTDTHSDGPEPLQSLASRIHPDLTLVTVPYRTFPLAGRRGTTVIDRSTAYPLFGERAGRVALDLVRSGKIDIVHGLGASVLGYARQRQTAAAPLVLNPQGLEEFGATDPSRARLKRAAYLPLRQAVLACARAADRVIATDKSLVPVVKGHLGVADERIVTIPNAIDLQWLDSLASAADGADLRHAAGIEDDEAVLLSVGRIEENKGFHILATALGGMHVAARPELGRWRWVIVGDGPYRSRLLEVIEDSGIAGQTIVAGRVADGELHAWYEAATLFVHPTMYEGSSLVTLEAMAHGRAVVATKAGGLPDKVRPGMNGWLVEPGDVTQLGSAIERGLSHREELEALGRAGRRIVEEEFSWRAAGSATIALYEELLADSDPSPLRA